MATPPTVVSDRKLRLTFPAIAISFVILTALWFGGPSPLPVSADHIPEPPDEIVYTINFTTSGEDAIGPGGLGADGNITLLDISWDEVSSVGGFTSFGGDTEFAGVTIHIPVSEFGGEIGGASTGAAGFDAKFQEFDKGTIGVNYPIEATFSVPKKDKFRRGDVINIGSSWRLMPGATLDTTPPTVGSVSVDGKFNVQVEAFFEVCVFVCSGQVVVFPFPEPPPGILSALLSVLPVDLPESLGEAELEDILGAIYDLIFSGELDLGEGTLFTVNLTEPIELDAKAVATYIVDNPDGIESPVAVVLGSLGAGLPIDVGLFELKKQLILLALPGIAGTLGLGESLDIPALENVINNADNNSELQLGALFELSRQLDGPGGPDRQTKIGALTFYLSNFTPFGCCSGTLGLPQVETTSSVDGDGRRLLATGNDEFVDVTIDPLAFIPLPIPLVFSLEVGPADKCQLSFTPFSLLSDCATLDFTIVSQPNNFTLTQNSDFLFDPTPRTRLTFPQPVAYTVTPCVPDAILDPANPVICSGTSSEVVYDLGSDIAITVPSGDFHTMDIIPTFMLPHRVSNDIVTNFDLNSSFKAGELGASTPNFEIVPAFTIIPEICAFGLCTPEVRFPGLSVPAINIGPLGPLFERRFADRSISDDSLFDQNQPPWSLTGFNTETGEGIPVDAEVKPTAAIAGPVVLDEGQAGTFSGAGAVEIDFGETLTFDWDFGDGISDTGETVSHAFLDNQSGGNPPYTVSVEANDGHVITDTASQNVQVNNVAPTLTVPSTRQANEGGKIDLSLYPFNRQLVNNPGAEQGVSGWAGSMTTETYAAQGTARPTRAEVLVDNSTPGFYVDLGEDLDGSSAFFPANDGPPLEVPDPPWGEITFSSGPFSGGDSLTIDTTGATVPNYAKMVDDLTSLLSEPPEEFDLNGLGAVMFQGLNMTGDAIYASRENSRGFFAGGNTLSSLLLIGYPDERTVQEASVTLFDRSGLTGNQTGPISNLGRYVTEIDDFGGGGFGGFGDVRSVQLSSGAAAVLFSNSDFTGDALYTTVTANVPFGARSLILIAPISLDPVPVPEPVIPAVSGSIVLYEHANFEGGSVSAAFSSGGTEWIAGLASVGALEQKISSYKIDGTATVLWRAPGFTGGAFYGTTNESFLSGINDDVSSLILMGNPTPGSIIEPATITLYDTFECTGASRTITNNGQYVTRIDYVGDALEQRISCFTLSPGAAVVMWRGPNLSGDAFYGTSSGNFRGGFNDDATSLILIAKVSPPPGAGPFVPVFPNFPPVTAQPNLSAASARLGTWLHRGRPSGGGWSGGRVAVPSSWPDQAENAIVYEINAGEGGITDVVANFAVDDGIWVWVNGNYTFGAIEPGTDTSVFEYANIALGDLPPGMNYIQVLRSDAMDTSDYKVKITGTTRGGRPAVDTPGSFFRENSYFFGGAGVSSASALQRIDVSAGADLIDEGGNVVGELSGFIGGHSLTNDSADVTAVFRNGGLAELGRVQIGPVSSGERDGATRMLQRVSTGPVPAGTRFVDVTISASRVAGNDADGYIDDLSFILLAPAGAIVRDPGLGDTHSGTVTWGDGTPTENALIEQEPGIARLLLNHVYVDEVNGGPDGPTGTFRVDVHAEDDDHAILGNGQDNDSFNVIVANVPPAVSGVNSAFAVNDNVTTLVATFEDAGILDAPWSASINWGDGVVTPGSVDQANRRVTGTHQYTSPGTGPNFETFGSVTVTDEDGGSATGYVTFTVVPLKIGGVHASPDRVVPEGTPLTGLAGGYVPLPPGGPVPADITYEYMYDFGDGTIYGPVGVTGTEGLGAGVSHSYGGNGQFVVTITVLGISEGNVVAAGSDNFVYNILNSTPSVNPISPQTVSEGDIVTTVATFSGPGKADHPSASINWGDGSPPVPGAVNRVSRTVTGTHVYAEDGRYVVTVTVEDDNGARGSNSFIVTANNRTPTVNASVDRPSLPEGSTVRLSPSVFNDLGSADTHTATVNWGDGTGAQSASLFESPSGPPGSAAGANGSVFGSHVYADEGSYTVAVCVADNDGATGCGTVPVRVTNASPVVFGGRDKAVQEGEEATISVTTFVDAGSADAHQATVNWGDGTSSTGLVSEAPFGPPGSISGANGVISGTHAYAADGTYVARILVCDFDGGCDSANLTVRVSNVPIEIVALELVSAQPAHIEGLPVDLVVNFIDKGTQDTHTATIDWGDGTGIENGTVLEQPFGPPGFSAGNNGLVVGSHQYADNGKYTVEVCIADDDTTICREERIKVRNALPVVEAGPDMTLSEGVFMPLAPATFSDSGFNSDTIPSVETFSVTIDWGDGTTEPAADITLLATSGSAGTPSAGTIQASHAYGVYGTYTVSVCVTDDDHDLDGAIIVLGQGCDTLTVTVQNVAPRVEAGIDRTTPEGSFFTLNPVTFDDDGYASEFTAAVDWGDGTTEPANEIMVIPQPSGEGELKTGYVQAIHFFSDDGAYIVETCVNDGRAVVCDTMTVEVFNVDPVLDDPVFLADGITFTSGDDAFLGRKLVEQTHEAEASDIGSDDLKYDWAFISSLDRFNGTLPPDPTAESTTTFNDGSAPAALPFNDPVPPNPVDARTHPLGTFPFSSGDTASVTFNAPGVYEVELSLSDDNAGTDFISLPKLVTDDCECVKSKGFWKHEFKERSEKDAKKVEKGQLIDEPTLAAYLDIIRFASSHFSEVVPLNSFQDAGNVLNTNKDRGENDNSRNPKGPSDVTNEGAAGGKKKGGTDRDPQVNKIARKREDALQQTLAAWLNFARGGVLWDEDVTVEPGTGHGDKAKAPVVLSFSEIIAEVESILNNPDATLADLEHAKDLAESINHHD